MISEITAFLLGTLVGVIVVRILLHASTRILERDIWRIDIRAMCGCRIETLAAMMRFLHQLTDVVIEAEFNGLTLIYSKHSKPKELVEQYREYRERCVDAPEE